MSTFTAAMKVMALRRRRTGWRRCLPPGLFKPCYEVAERFEYAVGSLDAPDMVITVPEGYRFDGASIPFVLRGFFPMAHPDYLQAACVHDWLYDRRETWVDLPVGGTVRRITVPQIIITRRFADAVFFDALGVLSMANHWRWCFWLAVRMGGALRWRKYEKGIA